MFPAPPPAQAVRGWMGAAGVWARSWERGCDRVVSKHTPRSGKLIFPALKSRAVDENMAPTPTRTPTPHPHTAPRLVLKAALGACPQPRSDHTAAAQPPTAPAAPPAHPPTSRTLPRGLPAPQHHHQMTPARRRRLRRRSSGVQPQLSAEVRGREVERQGGHGSQLRRIQCEHCVAAGPLSICRFL